jgi:3-hydroxybutyrate dehydrogenase
MFKDKAAVVTGSTSGIGLGIARALGAQGANIMLNGFGDRNAVEALMPELRAQYHVEVDYSAADMSRPEQATEMVEQCVGRFGGVDILVNNAGIQHTAPVEEFPMEKWEQIIAINLSSAFYSIKAGLPNMRRRRWGRIVNIASAHGLVASATKSAYVAAKHGLLGLTKVVALETAQSPITCNAICPGWVLTPLVQKQIDDAVARGEFPGTNRRRGCLPKTAIPRVRDSRADRCSRGLPVLERRQPDPRHIHQRRWRLDGAVTNRSFASYPRRAHDLRSRKPGLLFFTSTKAIVAVGHRRTAVESVR